MKKRFLLIALIAYTLPGFAQQTAFYKDPQTTFQEAKEYYQKEQYSLAYPLFKDLQEHLRETDRANLPVSSQEVDYYFLVCALKQNETRSVDRAITFIDAEKNTSRVQMMNYHLGEYYYRNQNFSDAANRYEQTNIVNLSNREIADMKFHQGYSYFTMQRFNQAKPLFKSIAAIRDDPNYLDANYYYGYLALRDRQYTEALESFRVVENEKAYASVVPFYIAQIYYIQGKKDEAIEYVKNKLKGGNTQYYDLELKQLIGHAHFERKEYAMALPYLEAYVNSQKKVRREDLYELSYCYYQANQLTKAIDGFKQLSGKEDSLSQHAMYLLGDAYLKTGQKTNARNAFLFCASNSSNSQQREISRYQYAKLSYELGYQDEALNSLRSFLADYPTSTYNNEARELLVDVLANTNNYRDAQVLLEGLSNPSQNAKRLYPRILYGRATEMINDGRMAEAEALLDKALKDPNNAAVLPFLNFWKGELAYRNNKLDDAIRYYNLYKDAGSPANGEANANTVRYNLGYCYLRKENYPASLSFFEPLAKNPALNSDPLTQDAYIRTADCYYMNKDFTKAKSMYDNVIKLSWPAEDYATFQVAMIAGIRSSNEKISLLNTMNRKFPASPLVTDANMEVANTYLAEQRYREALPFLNNVLKGNNASVKPQAYLKLGIAYYNIDNNTEALKQFKTLVTQYPNSEEAEDALDNVRVIYVEDGKPGEYADFMRLAGKPISVSTEDSLVYGAAFKLYQEGSVNNALTSFNSYLQKFPDGSFSIDANFYKGEIYNSKKDWNNALMGYESVAADAPNKFAEKAALTAARIYFFELKNYNQSEKFFELVKQYSSNQETTLEAMRGLLRSQYQLKKWDAAEANAKELVAAKGSSSDDKSLANMAIAKNYQVKQQYDLAIANYKSVVLLNKAALAAEARYEIANSWFAVNKLTDAEKAAFEVINKSGSYDYWVTKAYILLGDVYYAQKDYFNAKATFQSIVDNSINPELKGEAQTKLNKVIEAEGKDSKVGNN